MSVSNNINTYNDVAAILHEALTRGGAHYTLPSRKAAIRWRQRAYHYRNLLTKVEGTSPYDNLTLILNDATVTIDFAKLEGKLYDLNGAPIEAVSSPAEDLLLEAQKLLEE